jgi:hypothetical protein
MVTGENWIATRIDGPGPVQLHSDREHTLPKHTVPVRACTNRPKAPAAVRLAAVHLAAALRLAAVCLGTVCLTLGAAGCGRLLGIKGATECDIDPRDPERCLGSVEPDAGQTPTVPRPPPTPPPPRDAGTPSLCERYCSTVMSACTGADAVYRLRRGEAYECLRLCALMSPGDPTLADPKNQNTVTCRLNAAEQVGPGVEIVPLCASAAPLGQPGCGTGCENYCSLMVNACPVTSQRFEALDGSRVAGCLQACRSEFPVIDNEFSVSQDSLARYESQKNLQCRLWHLGAVFNEDNIYPLERVGLGGGVESLHCRHAVGLAPCGTDMPEE